MTRAALAAIEISVSEAEHRQLGRFLELLLAETARVNLTGVRELDSAWALHVADSLVVAERLRERDAGALLDLGAGGGVPGVPLAIVAPKTRVRLLDATRKKMDAVNRILTQLDIANVSTVWGRAELIAKSAPHQRGYDVVTARAVGSLATLVEHAHGLLRPQGVCWFWKSIAAVDAEVAAAAPVARRRGLKLREPVRYRLPDPHGERVVVEYEMTRR